LSSAAALLAASLSSTLPNVSAAATDEVPDHGAQGTGTQRAATQLVTQRELPRGWGKWRYGWAPEALPSPSESTVTGSEVSSFQRGGSVRLPALARGGSVRLPALARGGSVRLPALATTTTSDSPDESSEDSGAKAGKTSRGMAACLWKPLARHARHGFH
jgi:hypothetical protein